MSPSGEFRLDRAAVRRSFGRASAQYHEAARLQSAIGAELLERLQYFPLEPRVIIDLGAGTGRGAAALRARFPRARVIAVDLAFPMVQEARRRQRFWRRYDCVCADGCALPFAAQSIDLVYCNLMLQWCAEPAQLFEQLQRVLRPGGLLLFSSFGPDTLQEIRTAFAHADGHTHTNRFTDMHDIGDMLVAAGFADPVMDMEQLTLTYSDASALMRELKHLGATNVTRGRPHGLMGRGRWQRALAALEAMRRDGRIPATFEVVYGHAWKGEPRRTAEGHPIVKLSRPGS